MITHPNNKFSFSEINMAELDSIFSKLKKSSSTIDDGISMIMINYMKDELKPLVLNLINSTPKVNCLGQAPSLTIYYQTNPHICVILLAFTKYLGIWSLNPAFR